MIFLVDNQLPVALARAIAEHGVACRHVRDVGLDSASDETIWQYAKDHHCVIVSKDDDFQILTNRRGPPPPVVWVRIGNCRKAVLLGVFERAMPDLIAALESGSGVVEIR